VHVSDRLIDAYDALLFDLDGVLYVGADAVPHAVECVVRASEIGKEIWYATNNASRSAEDVARHLADLGFPAIPHQVLVASQVTAHLARKNYPQLTRARVVGTKALASYMQQAGFQICTSATTNSDEALIDGSARAELVVQGHSTQTNWADLTEALRDLHGGAVWIATNEDLTIPLAAGLGVGNGAMVAALATAAARRPDLVVGKPHPWMFEEFRRRSTAGRVLIVGDRLDTDIAWANSVGADSLLVRTGVDAAAHGDQASHLRPTWVAEDLRGLFSTGSGCRH